MGYVLLVCISSNGQFAATKMLTTSSISLSVAIPVEMKVFRPSEATARTSGLWPSMAEATLLNDTWNSRRKELRVDVPSRR